MTRPPPTRTSLRDPALDGLRGLAVLMVFVFHYGGGVKSSVPIVHWLGILCQTGWVGVSLFFALSGFLITGGLWDSLGQPHCLRNFYARRALRIFPLYYLALALAVLFALAHGALFSELRPFAIYAFFLQNLPVLAAQVGGQPSPLPLYHFWSLAVEEQFYLLWPLLLFFASNRRQALRFSLYFFALSVVFRLTVFGLPIFSTTVDHHFFDSFLLTHAGAIALGAALALALRGPEWPRIQRFALPAFLAGTASYIVVSYFSDSPHLTRPVQFILGLTAIHIACAATIPLLLRGGLARSLASFRPLTWLGRISYGFYIFHVLLGPLFDAIALHFTHTAIGSTYQVVRLFTAFSIALLVSWLSYEFFELPILQLNRRFPLHQPLPDK